MLSITLFILQLVAFLTYPPILLSILSGHNVISEMSKGSCKDIKNVNKHPDKQKKINEKCDQLMNIRSEIYFIMGSFVLAIILFAISIYFEATKKTKLFKIFMCIGGLFSLISLALLFYVIYSIGNIVKEIEKMHDDNGNSNTDTDPIKYLWYMSILPMIFTLITIILVIINYFKKSL